MRDFREMLKWAMDYVDRSGIVPQTGSDRQLYEKARHLLNETGCPLCGKPLRGSRLNHLSSKCPKWVYKRGPFKGKTREEIQHANNEAMTDHHLWSGNVALDKRGP